MQLFRLCFVDILHAKVRMKHIWFHFVEMIKDTYSEVKDAPKISIRDVFSESTLTNCEA